MFCLSFTFPATKSICNTRITVLFARPCTYESIISENPSNVYCLPLVRRFMFGREICFYICTYWRNYRRKYWWPRCENKLSRRENNSMFNCCLHPGGRPSSIVAILLKSIIRAFIVLYSHLYLLFNNLLYLHVLKNKYLKKCRKLNRVSTKYGLLWVYTCWRTNI